MNDEIADSAEIIIWNRAHTQLNLLKVDRLYFVGLLDCPIRISPTKARARN